MMDHETRFMIAKLVADTKYTKDVKSMFVEAMMIASKIPRTLISDGAPNFPGAWKFECRAKNYLQKNRTYQAYSPKG